MVGDVAWVVLALAIPAGGMVGEGWRSVRRGPHGPCGRRSVRLRASTWWFGGEDGKQAGDGTTGTVALLRPRLSDPFGGEGPVGFVKMVTQNPLTLHNIYYANFRDGS